MQRPDLKSLPAPSRFGAAVFLVLPLLTLAVATPSLWHDPVRVTSHVLLPLVLAVMIVLRSSLRLWAYVVELAALLLGVASGGTPLLPVPTGAAYASLAMLGLLSWYARDVMEPATLPWRLPWRRSVRLPFVQKVAVVDQATGKRVPGFTQCVTPHDVEVAVTKSWTPAAGSVALEFAASETVQGAIVWKRETEFVLRFGVAVDGYGLVRALGGPRGALRVGARYRDDDGPLPRWVRVARLVLWGACFLVVAALGLRSSS